MLFTNSAANIALAADRRFLRHQYEDGTVRALPVPHPHIWEEGVISSASRFKDQLIAKFLNMYGPQDPVSLKESVAYAPPHKKKQYAAAVKSLLKEEWNWKDAKVTAFIKWEKKKWKDGSAPRLILPRSTRYCAMVGSYLRPLEPKLMDAINTLYGDLFSTDLPVVLKGLNAAERGNIIAQAVDEVGDDWVFVGLDALHWDKHVHEHALRFEHLLYSECFSKEHQLELLRLLSAQIKNHVTAYSDDGYKVKFKRKGGRMTGDINTSLGNITLMVTLILGYLLENIRNSQELKRVRVINDGDDTGIIMPKRMLRYLEGLAPVMLGYGIQLKTEDPVYKLEKIVFCQTQPVYSSHFKQYIMVRTLRTALMKDSTILTKLKNVKDLASWRRVVGIGGKTLVPGIPVMGEFYDVFYRNTSEKDDSRKRIFTSELLESGFIRLSRGMHFVNQATICPRARLSFYDAFDVTPEQQQILEEYFRSLNFGSFEYAGLEKISSLILSEKTNITSNCKLHLV